MEIKESTRQGEFSQPNAENPEETWGARSNDGSSRHSWNRDPHWNSPYGEAHWELVGHEV